MHIFHFLPLVVAITLHSVDLLHHKTFTIAIFYILLSLLLLRLPSSMQINKYGQDNAKMSNNEEKQKEKKKNKQIFNNRILRTNER